MQPLPEHLALLGAAIPAADTKQQLRSRQQQFAAGRFEGSLGETSLGQVQHLQQYTDNGYHDDGEIPQNSTVANEHQSRRPLVQETSADNGLLSGNYCINLIGRTVIKIMLTDCNDDSLFKSAHSLKTIEIQ